MVVQKSSLWPGRGFSCEQSCCPDKFSPHCKLGYRFQTTEAEFLDENKTKVFRVFLLAVNSHINSFPLRFLFLQTHATSYIFLRFVNSASVHSTKLSQAFRLIEYHNSTRSPRCFLLLVPTGTTEKFTRHQSHKY